MNVDKRKVIIIGIDGGSWNVLDALIEKGKMPCLKSFVENALVQNLESTIPPMTGCAWSSFQTGMKPGSHGVFHFIQFDRDSLRFKFVNSSAIKAETIWGIASAHGKKVIALNVPMTYPPAAVNGVMVSGIPVPEAGPNIMYPSGLYEELTARIGEYRTVVHHHVYYSQGLHFFIDELIKTLEKRRDAALHLLTRHEWDLAMVHFQSVDVLQHVLWNILMGTNEVSESDRSAVIRFYERLDQIIGEVLAKVESATLKVIMSDHGFGGDDKVVFINKWLIQEGLMVPRGRLRLGRTLSHVANLLRRIDRHRWRTRLLKPGKRRELLLKESNDAIDWNRTSAFSATVGPYALIYLNPAGSVQIEKEALRHRIVQKLVDIVDPQTNKKIIKEILYREQVYRGSYIEDAPDLICVAKDGYAFDFHSHTIGKSLVQNIDPMKYPPGSHRLQGILGLAGECVNRKANLGVSRIADLAPTILFVLGLPVPGSMEGRVLTEAFTEKFLTEIPLVVDESKKGEGNRAEYDFSDTEEKEVEKSLRGLGYF